MNRRDFLTTLAATAATTSLPRLVRAQDTPATASLTIDATATGPTIPLDFTGLSYETAQLANPAFFSAANKTLIDLFRGLSPQGVLRLGGNTSEFTTWSPNDITTPPPFDATGPATHQHENIPTTNTPLALKNLRAFLDATNWSLIYGLNAARGTTENAVAEAIAVHQILGPRLICFQLGNEPDAWRNRYRPTTFTYADYAKEWAKLHNAIAEKIPGAKFAGPDPSNKVDYITGFAADAHLYSDIVLLTGHYYTMGPASSPKSTLERLLDPDPKLAANLETIMAAAKSAHLPYRMTEGNSCWDGGKPGVSDTLASALWCADMMLQFAHAGAAGVNLHGGGEGFYTPIAGASATSLTKRPEYSGIQFAQQLTGSTFLRATLTGASTRVTAYAFQNKHDRSLVVINKDDQPLTLSVQARPQSKAVLLTGPSFDSKATPDFHPITASRSNRLEIPARSATLYTL
jgi:hypothetical protein